MDVKEFAKDNWPLLLGGAVGLFLVLRLASNGSNSQSGNAPVILNTAPSEAAIMASAQTEIARQQMALQSTAMNHDMAMQTQQLQLEREAMQAAARNNTLTAAGTLLQAQGVAASGAGTSVAQMVAALNAPAMAAVESAAYENAAALQAASVAAAASYQTQGESIKGISGVLSQYVQIAQSGMSAIGAIGSKSTENRTPETISALGGAITGGYNAYRNNPLYW